jgi:hypothetical protein
VNKLTQIFKNHFQKFFLYLVNTFYFFRSPTCLLLWVWLRRHLGRHHPALRLRGAPHLRQGVRGDLLQGEADRGGGRGGGRRGLDGWQSRISSLHVIIPFCTSPPLPPSTQLNQQNHQKPSFNHVKELSHLHAASATSNTPTSTR